MKPTNNIINPPHPRPYLHEHFTNKLMVHLYCWWGRVYGIMDFYRKLLVNPPHPRDYLHEHFTNKLMVHLYCWRGRVYNIMDFYRKLLVNPPLQIWLII